MGRRSTSAGAGLYLMMLVILLVLFPMLLSFVRKVQLDNDFSMRERRVKANRALAHSVMVDFMRQFSQNPVETGNLMARVGVTAADDPLVRLTDSFGGAGFTNVTVTTHTETNSLFFRATGHQPKPGQPADARIKRMTGIVRIENPFLRFSDVEDPRWTGTWTAGGVNGSIYCPTGLTIANGVAITFGDPTVVFGDVNCGVAPPTIFTGNLYLSGVMTGNCVVAGATVHQAPLIPLIPIDMRYYALHNSTMTQNNEWWIFGVNGADGEMGRYQDAAGVQGAFISSVTIPAVGAIVFSSGAVVHVSGQVRGRVTLVAGSTAPPPRDAVFIENDLIYADGVTSADSNHSLAILTDGRIYFRKPAAGNLRTHGFICSILDPALSRNMFLTLAPVPGSWDHVGSLGYPAILVPSAAYPSSTTGDPALALFPPPGLPAQANLVSWRLNQ